MHALGIAAPAPTAFLGAGAGYAVRARGRVGFGASATAGAREDGFAARGEALVSFGLDPARQRGLAPYVAAGVAAVSGAGRTNGYVVAVVGLAANPRARRGWFVEGGVGGGVRVSAGLVFRSL